MNSAKKNMKKLMAVVERGEGDSKKSFWTNVGVAFENRDGSWNLRFDFFPTSAATTIQLRDIDRDEDDRSR